MSLKRQAPQSSPSGPVSVVDNASSLINPAVATISTSGSATPSPPNQAEGKRATKKRQSAAPRTGQACERCKVSQVNSSLFLGFALFFSLQY